MIETTHAERLFEDLKDIRVFCECAGGLKLRSYQQDVAQAILTSVLEGRGLAFTVLFPRQSGKNELQAQLEAFLLACLSNQTAEIVKISPTYQPQTINAMRRLERVLENNVVLRQIGWKKEDGYTYRVGKARILFLSGSAEANIVGATASTLLEVDEAQDIAIAKFDKEIAPMAASTNATRVFWGTAWTSRTLLARELRAAQEREREDGQRRTWVLAAPQVGQEVPAYRAFVDEQVKKLGRSNPMVKTQFFSEEIDGQEGMFPPQRRQLMLARHAAEEGPEAAAIYCGLLDVAGEDEGINALGEGTAANPGRDSTALTIVKVDRSTLSDPLIARPTYHVVRRQLWLGVKHSALYGQLRRLAQLWNWRWLVVDATGVGAGLASFLDTALPGKVLPFVFNGSSKSRLGWDFLGIVDGGRWQEHVASASPEQALFFEQLGYCQYEIQPGPEHRMKWGVPDGTRDYANGEAVHDDLILSAALSAILDEQEWGVCGAALVVGRGDPMAEMSKGW